MSTLQDVAKRSGVSMMTVSRIINNVPGKASEETRARVLKAIEELNYHPNTIGRALHGRALQIIGVVSPVLEAGIVLENPYYYELLRGIEEGCQARGYDLLIATRKQQKPQSVFSLYFEKKVEGLILAAPGLTETELSIIREKDIPCVVVGERPGESFSWIDSDNLEGGKMAARKLISAGHTRIGLIRGKKNARNAEDREKGFMLGLKQAGLKLNPEWMLPGDFTFNGGMAAMDLLHPMPEKPSALFCTNDLSALGFLRRAQELGYRIPNDFSIIGFDGIPAGQYSHPSIVSIRQPLMAMGKDAVNALFEKIAGEHPRQTVHPVQLIEGSSIQNALVRQEKRL